MAKPKTRAKLVMVNFKADPTTIRQLDELRAAAVNKDGVLDGGRSYVIRRAIKNEHARLVRR